MTNTTTFTQTFDNGFTVQINGNKMGTNCPDQKEWLDAAALGSSAVLLRKFAPASQSNDSLIALALQDQRANWIGIQQLLTK